MFCKIIILRYRSTVNNPVVVIECDVYSSLSDFNSYSGFCISSFFLII